MNQDPRGSTRRSNRRLLVLAFHKLPTPFDVRSGILEANDRHYSEARSRVLSSRKVRNPASPRSARALRSARTSRCHSGEATSPASRQPTRRSPPLPGRPGREEPREGNSAAATPNSAPHRQGEENSTPRTPRSALRRPRSQLDLRLGGDSSAFVRLINALARASRETMLVQKYRTACAQARAALCELKDPKRKLTESERRAIVLQVDDILGLGSPEDEESEPADHLPESPASPSPDPMSSSSSSSSSAPTEPSGFATTA